MALSVDGRVQCVFEFERLFGIRYYHLMGYGSKDWSDVSLRAPRHREHLLEGLRILAEKCECDGGRPCPRSLDFGVMIGPAEMWDVPQIVEEVFTVKQWRWTHHHEAHALLGFLASPFQRALVVSYDGGGDDGFYNAFYGEGTGVQRVARLDVNFAGAYNSMTNLMTEIYPECEEILGRYCLHVDNFSSDWMVISAYRPSELMLSDAGKIMGYAAFAAERETTPAIREVVTKHLDQALGHATFEEGKRKQSMPHGSVPREMLKLACGSIDNQHLLAAELQRQWQQRSLHVIQSLLDKLETPVDGLVLMGGCALNVQANEFIQETLGMEVFVPPSPNDCGLSIGGLFSVSPPKQRHPLQYLGH